MQRLLRLLPFLCLLCSSCGAVKTPLQKASEEFFDLPLDGSLSLTNGDGSIHVYGWYEPRVRLATLRRAYTAARLSNIQIATRQSRGSLAIASIVPPAAGFFADRSGTIDFTLNVPETARLTLQLRNGEISLQGLRGGEANISLTNGRITALNSFAKVRARSTNGVMEVFFSWWENAPISYDYELRHGRIAAILPALAQFQLDAATANGRIGNAFGFPNPPDTGPGQSLRATTQAHPPASFHFRTGSGNISIDRR